MRHRAFVCGAFAVLGWFLPGWLVLPSRGMPEPSRPAEEIWRPRVPDSDSAGSGDNGASTDASHSPVPDPRGRAEASASLSDTFLPSGEGSRLLEGEHGAEYLHSLYWRPLSPPPAETPRLVLSEDYWEDLRWVLSYESELGTPPWSDAKFSVVGVPRSPALRVVGRDFHLPASPEASLSWYQQRNPKAHADSQQADALLGRLRDFENSQRRYIAKLLAIAYSLDESDERDVSAYLVTSSEVVLLPRGERMEVDALSSKIETDFSFLRGAVREYLE